MADDAPQSILLRLEASGQRAPRVLLRGAESSRGSETCGRYEVLGQLAEGGVGEVLRGRDIDIGRDVALKVLREKYTDHPELLQRFVDEAQIAGQLQHPGIVPVYELGMRADRRPYIAMKLVKGRTLAAMITAGDTSRRRLLQIFEQMCRAVAYAHERGVVHRDLKPSNVMIGAFGEVQVLDWGFAKILSRGGVADERRRAADPDVTRIATVGEGSASIAGSIMGTPAYMPPEQALGQVDDLDERSDVFSLGAILCEILTGQPPYTGEDLLTQAGHARLEDAHARLDECNGVSDVVALARRCLSPLRVDRPAHAGEVADVVLAHLAAVEERAHKAVVNAAEASEEAERVGMEARQQRRARKQTLVLAVVVLLALVAGSGTYATLESQRRERAERASDTVTAALTEAQHLRGARAWTEAAAAAEKAVALARDGDDALRRRARSALDAIAAEAGAARLKSEQQAREKAFLAELTEVRLESGEDFGTESETAARLANIFGAHGIDVEVPNQAITRIERKWGAIRVELAAALDGWARIRRNLKREWKDLGAIARGIDPDPWRGRLRDAVAALDAEALEELQREALERSDLSVRTLDLLALALWNAEKPEPAIALLRRAWRSDPGDFSVCAHLGFELRQQDAPAEAIRFCEAAVALRPTSAVAWHFLAHACAGSGKHARAEEAFRKAWQLAPKTSIHPSCLATQLEARGQHDGAIAALREAIRLGPNLVKAHFNLGVALSRKGDFDGAIASYREAIRLDPDHAKAHHGLGNALFRKGDFDGAIASYREAIRLEPDFAEAHCSLGSALASKGDFDGAIAASREAIRLEPDLAEAHCSLGSALVSKGDFDGAIVASREAIRLDPDHVQARLKLGNAFREKGDYVDAVAAVREAIRRRPELAEAHFKLGLALYLKGDLDGAIAAYREAIRLKPDYAEARDGLGGALVKNGELDRAITSFREAIRIKPDYAMAHTNLGTALLRKGDPEGAIAAYREGIRLKPDFAGAHYNLGVGLGRKGDLDGAIASYREAIRLDPDHADAHGNLGAALSQKGDLDGAIASYREAIRLKPDDAAIHDNVGAVLQNKGDNDGAIAAFREAIRLKSDFANAHHNLGIALWHKGDLDGAIAANREAIRLKPDDAEAHNNLGIALRDKGDLDGAIASYREAIRLKPGVANTHNKLGNALVGKGDLEGALAAYREAIRHDPENAMAHYNLGNALRGKGDLEGAIAAYCEAIRLDPDYAEVHCNLGNSLMQRGRFGEALESLRRGHALGSRRADWPYPSREWVENAERWVDIEERLPAILAGDAQPRDAEECARFALVCLLRKRFADAARLYVRAFGMGVTLPEHRYDAACAAVLANTPAWRQRALEWLRAELGRHAKDPAATKATLEHWQSDPDLAAVRDRIDSLPEAERAGWTKLWADVDSLLKRAVAK